ncbi:hypothetical protein [Amycolatopsis sp. CA-230715]|uniref:hypothetical protein n=1 Tax=Amycolatopsis sp. CA-230715 TaxID=2745196 RepID=UPI001C01567F|nr:hypothetical protein [Amycolatopsis sp. CA-230715]
MAENPVTVFDLFEDAVRPVLEAVPRRAGVEDLYNPEIRDEDIGKLDVGSADPADLVAEAERYLDLADSMARMGIGEHGVLNETGRRVYSVMLKGPVRSVLSGVHENAPSPLDIRAYADEEAGILWYWRGDGTVSIRGSLFEELPDKIAELLPEHPAGHSKAIRIRAGREGVVPVGQRRKAEAVREMLARPRTGTILLDLMAFGTVFAEYPRHGFAVIDNDLGRYALAVHDTEGEGDPSDCSLVLCEFSAEALAGWIDVCLELAMGGREQD